MDFVWTPIWQTNYFDEAQNLMPVNPDPRARVWYDGNFELGGSGMSSHIGVSTVWDIYMIYEAGQMWAVEGTDTPGTPDYLQSKIGVGTSFNKLTFADALMSRLPPCEGGVFDADTNEQQL